MYEIWSLGHKPFEGYTNLQVCAAVVGTSMWSWGICLHATLSLPLINVYINIDLMCVQQSIVFPRQ